VSVPRAHSLRALAGTLLVLAGLGHLASGGCTIIAGSAASRMGVAARQLSDVYRRSGVEVDPAGALGQATAADGSRELWAGGVILAGAVLCLFAGPLLWAAAGPRWLVLAAGSTAIAGEVLYFLVGPRSPSALAVGACKLGALALAVLVVARDRKEVPHA
jgi:hypothetical protein